MFSTPPRFTPRLLLVCIAMLVSVLAGCSGNSTGSANSNTTSVTGSTTAADPVIASATFHVDLDTGQVSVLSQNTPGDAVRKSVFTGTAISFTPSVVSDQPGDVGVKVVNVSLTNHFSLPIGQTPGGEPSNVRVLFSAFTNSFTDLRPRAAVSTLAGTGASGHLDGPIGTATFTNPHGTAVDANGNMYVTDFSSNRIRKIAAGFVSTLAGGGSAASVDGLGAAASFNGPYGIAVNPVDGALIVADYYGQRIRRVTATGAVSTIAGAGAAGSANGSGAVATFNYPAGVAVDDQGQIYVTETAGNRIRRITFAGGAPNVPANYTVTTLAGSGAAGSTDGAGTAASFNSPTGLALGDNNDLYVCDRSNNKIRRVGLDGAVTTIAGLTAAGSADGTGNVASFNGPMGIAHVNGAFIISDYAGNRLRQLTLTAGGSVGQAQSWNVRTLAGTGVAGSADGAGDAATFNGPVSLSADGAGNIYVSDNLSNKIRKVIPTSGYFPLGLATGSAPATPVQLSNPDGIIPQSGFGANLPYIAYEGPIAAGGISETRPWWFVVPAGVTAFEFTVTVEGVTGGLEPPGPSSSIVRTLAGITGSTGFADGVGAAARFGTLLYDALDDAGNLYVTDSGGHALRRITPDGIVTTIAGGPGNSVAVLDGLGNQAKVGNITGVAVSRDGTKVFFGDGNQVRLATIPSYFNPWDPANWTITTIAGTAAAGKTDGFGNLASFNGIEGMALDPNSGDLYLSEFYGNRIRKLRFMGGDPSVNTNWYVTTLAGDNTAVTGASGYVDATGTSARFNQPRGIALDRVGNLYVADTFNYRIRKITPNQVVTTLAGNGTLGYADGAGLTTAKFRWPSGIAVDSAGYVYVGDVGNSDVRRIDPQGNVTTLAGTVGSTSGADGAGGVATFKFSYGVAVNLSGDIYVCDEGSVRLIQRVINTGTN